MKFNSGFKGLIISVSGTIPVKLCHYRPVQAPRISRQSAHGENNVVSPMHRPPLPPGDTPGIHFCHRLGRL